MSSERYEKGSSVPESYSRILDDRVAAQEMPYGYLTDPPAADTGDYDQSRLESKKEYAIRKGKVR